jgi:hypothetical protein
MSANVKVVQASDIARCPVHSLLPAHYRADGTCLHYALHTVHATGQPQSFVGVTFDADGTEHVKPGSAGQSVDVACDSCPWTHVAVVTSTVTEAEERLTALHRALLDGGSPL